MGWCDRVEVWRDPLFLRPRQLELFGQVRIGLGTSSGTGLPLRLLEDSGATARLLRDVYPRVRGGVVCMTTAAHLHDLLPGLSDPLWLGVPLRVHVPQRDPAELHVLRWSNHPAFEVGVERTVFQDVVIMCTTRERTLVDLVRYRRRLGGPAVAARCLRAYSAAGGRRATVRSMADATRMPHPARLVLETLLDGMDAAS